MLKLQGWMEKDTQANICQKKHGVSKQVSDKINFKASSFTELYFLKVKGLAQQKNITILNLYTHNSIDSKYIKQKLTKLRDKKIDPQV